MNVGQAVYGAIVGSVDYTLQTMGTGACKLQELRKNPETLQKICQLAYSSIEALNIYYEGVFLPKVHSALVNVSKMHNFFGFIKIPYTWFYAVKVENLNSYKLAASIKKSLTRMGVESTTAQREAEKFVFAQLKQMVKEDRYYKNFDLFKEDLEERIRKDEKYSTLVLGDDLIRAFHSLSLLETVSHICFTALDLVCVPFFLHEWDLLNPVKGAVSAAVDWVGLGSIAKGMGEIRIFQWAGQYSLGDWVTGLCCAGLGVQFVEAARELHDENLTPKEKLNTQWKLAAAGTEFVYNVASLLQASQVTLIALAIIAKTIGILRFVAQKPIEIFNRELV